MPLTRHLLPLLLLASGLLPAAEPTLPPPESMAEFVVRDGDRLTLGGEDFRFVSVNLPDVLQVITNYRFDNATAADRFRIPDAFEQQDALRSVRQLGGRVARTFVITCSNAATPAAMFHVGDDGATANEPALVALDRLLAIGREEGIRLIVPLIAYRSGLRGDPDTYGPDFWSVGSPANLKFKTMLTQLLGRTNSINGIPYRDDPTILGWQTGNELVMGDDATRHAWLHDIAATIKHLDPHHLLIDGRNKPGDVYNHYDAFADDPNLDAVSYHTYVNLPEADTPAGTLRLIRNQLRGRKPVIVTEVAMYTSSQALRDLLDEILADGAVGAQWWGLRFHNRDGGFYKHSDRGSRFEDLNWPGFAADSATAPDDAHEHEILGILHDYAARVSGRAPTPVVRPAVPTLLPTNDPAHLSWQGSTGATGYEVQRAPAVTGPWTTVVPALDDHRLAYVPLFGDESAPLGTDFYYRVMAHNTAGASAPSNVIGPLRTDHHRLVDNLLEGRPRALATATNLKAHRTLIQDGNFAARGAVTREHPNQPGRLSYGVPGPLTHFTVFAFNATTPPRFVLTASDGSRREVHPTATSFQGDRRTRYDFVASAGTANARQFAIELPANAAPELALSRIELAWTPPSQP